MTNPATTAFTVGTTYQTRSTCDYNCIFSWTVTARTAKTITVVGSLTNTPARKGIKVWRGVETAKPLGSYSMAPIMSADRTAA